MSGTSCRVEFTRKAARAFRKLPPEAKKRILTSIDALSNAPRPRGALKLSGEENLYRLRVGAYRVLYQIRDRDLLVLVVDAGHRRDIYR